MMRNKLEHVICENKNMQVFQTRFHPLLHNIFLPRGTSRIKITSYQRKIGL